MNNTDKRKNRIKNFAIVFLVILLILTFFSNTIQNYSLPEVAAQYTSSGEITNKVRGTGTVETADPYSVVYKQSRKIESVAVKVGDEVEKGDVLYVLEEGESEELKTALEALETAKETYQKDLVSKQVSTADSAAVENGTSDSVADMQKKITALQSNIDAIQSNIDTLNAQITLWSEGSASSLTERKNLEDAENTLADWKQQDTLNKAELASDETALDNAEKKFKSTYGVDYRDSDNSTVTKSYNDVSNNGANSESTYNTLVKAITDAEKEVEDDNAKIATSAYQMVYAQYAVEEAQKVIDDKVADLKYQLSVQEANLKTAQDKLTEYTTDASLKLDLSSDLKAISDAQAKVDELEKEEGSTEITAPVAGTILTMGKVAGETIESGETVSTIQIAGKGYTLSMTVTNEQAQLISVGDEAEISDSWWYSDVKARITSIRPDPTSPSTSKKVTFELEGDVTNGQSLTLTVGKRTASYENIVPNSAIREDNNGKFVYRVNSKSTPLGNRYIIERVDVKVLATDDTESAISGDLEGWDYVVTTSSKPLTDGQQVRLKD